MISDTLAKVLPTGAVLTIRFPSGELVQDLPISWLRFDGHELEFWIASEDRDHIFSVRKAEDGEDNTVVLHSPDGMTLTVAPTSFGAQHEQLEAAQQHFADAGGVYPPNGWYFGQAEQAA